VLLWQCIQSATRAFENTADVIIRQFVDLFKTMKFHFHMIGFILSFQRFKRNPFGGYYTVLSVVLGYSTVLVYILC